MDDDLLKEYNMEGKKRGGQQKGSIKEVFVFKLINERVARVAHPNLQILDSDILSGVEVWVREASRRARRRESKRMREEESGGGSGSVKKRRSRKISSSDEDNSEGDGEEEGEDGDGANADDVAFSKTSIEDELVEDINKDDNNVKYIHSDLIHYEAQEN